MQLGLFALTPAVRSLMILTAACFAADHLLHALISAPGAPRPLPHWLGLVADPRRDPISTGLQLWRPFTYMLVHGDVWHLFWNMLGLWFMGVGVEHHLGARRFYQLYVFSGLVGAMLAIAAGAFTPVPLVIGASAGVLGCVFAFIRMFPEAVIYLFMTIPVKALYLGAIYAAMLVLNTLSGGGSSGVSHWAHLGGMVGGWWLAGHPQLQLRFAAFQPLGWLQRRWRRRHLRAVPQAPKTQAPAVRVIPDPPHPAGPTLDAELEAQVDRILDKVRKSGIGALSQDERNLLDRHSTTLRLRDGGRH